ncbi:winged helix-turn-helix domain-containing protein [Marininema halotolerans]|nr:crosslink repair DNA glycosylase YcaQ family protein [Marininema halotolerans]
MSQPSPFSVSRMALCQFLIDVQQLSRPFKETDPTPSDVLTLIQQLECVQLDAVSIVEKNQHLVLAARLPGYHPSLLNHLLSEGNVFEFWANAACVLPMEDYPLLKPIRQRRQELLQPQLDTYSSIVQEVLNMVEKEGPLPSRAFQSSDRVHGYWDNKAATTKVTSHVLNLLTDSGQLRVVRREGNERFFDLTARTIPKALLDLSDKMPLIDATRGLIDKYLRAYRIIDPTDARFGWLKLRAKERQHVVKQKCEEGSLTPIAIEGVRRSYYMSTEDVDWLQRYERNHKKNTDDPIRFLPPLDNLLWRRERIADLFDFHYRWEIYTPRAKRQYGAFAMPILDGTRLIGRMDPQLDRTHRQLHVRLQLESTITKTPSLQNRLHQAINDFADFHCAQKVVIANTEN